MHSTLRCHPFDLALEFVQGVQISLGRSHHDVWISADTIHHPSGISCPHCWDTLSEKTRRSAIDRQKQIELAKARNLPHPIGSNYKQTPSEA